MARRGPTYAELGAERDRLRKENGILTTALQLLDADELRHVGTVRDPDDKQGKYLVGFRGALRADGGVLLITWHCPGQRDSLEVMLLEHTYAQMGVCRHTRYYQVLGPLIEKAYLMARREVQLEEQAKQLPPIGVEAEE